MYGLHTCIFMWIHVCVDTYTHTNTAYIQHSVLCILSIYLYVSQAKGLADANNSLLCTIAPVFTPDNFVSFQQLWGKLNLRKCSFSCPLDRTITLCPRRFTKTSVIKRTSRQKMTLSRLTWFVRSEQSEHDPAPLFPSFFKCNAEGMVTLKDPYQWSNLRCQCMIVYINKQGLNKH